jgi:membrane-associated phospholipid phosphatase
VLYAVNAWRAFARRDPVGRMQYLLCTTLIWALLGNVGCTLLASGGPVYYGRLTGLPDPFVPLFQYLDAANGHWLNFSREVQEAMWDVYRVNGRDGKIAGAVAAMPSLHVASACGFYLVAKASNRRLGWVFLTFLVLMLLGSVHLGRHYAIDGYAGIAGTIAIWWVCGRLVRWPVMHGLLWRDAQHSAVSSP